MGRASKRKWARREQRQAAQAAEAQAAEAQAAERERDEEVLPGLRLLKRQPDLTDVLLLARESLLAEGSLTPYQLRKLRKLCRCRTGELGFRGQACEAEGCDTLQLLACSCHDRACTRCAAQQQVKWQERRKRTALATIHLHVVLTTPPELRFLGGQAESAGCYYRCLLAAAKEALLGIGRETLGGELGATLVLHTWNQRAQLHPHVHAIVSDGAWKGGADGRWVAGREAPGGCFLPQGAVVARFKQRLLAKLERAHTKGKLVCDAQRLQRALGRARRRNWIGRSYRRPCLESSARVIDYLARYASGMVLHAGRILAFDRQAATVTIKVRGQRPLTLSAVELARRYLLHLLPPHFQRFRHVGLYSTSEASKERRAWAEAANPEPSDPDALQAGDEAEGHSEGGRDQGGGDQGEGADGEGGEREEKGSELWERLGRDYRRCPRCKTPGSLVCFDLGPTIAHALLSGRLSVADFHRRYLSRPPPSPAEGVAVA